MSSSSRDWLETITSNIKLWKCRQCKTKFRGANSTRILLCKNCKRERMNVIKRIYTLNKYDTDPEYKKKALEQSSKYQKNRYATDSEFRRKAIERGKAWYYRRKNDKRD